MGLRCIRSVDGIYRGQGSGYGEAYNACSVLHACGDEALEE